MRSRGPLMIVLGAIVVGALAAFAGSWARYHGPPPALLRWLMQTRAGDALLQRYLHDSAPPPPAGTQPLRTGDRLPALAFTSTDGRRYTLDQWHGKTVLINFWATWCLPCRREMPALMAAQAHHASHAQIVGIAIDRPDAVRAFVRQHPLNYPALLGPVGDTSLPARFGDSMGALPYSVLVAPDGRIHATHFGPLAPVQLEHWLD